MLRYFIRRVFQLIPVFFITTFLIFLVIRIIPGDPIQAQFGERRIPDNLRAAYIERYHFDEPLWKQYVLYMRDVLRFDLGDSIANQRPINEIFRESLPRTATLASMSVFFIGVFGIPLGIISARRKDGPVDNGFLIASLVMLATPAFVLGLLAQLFFGVRWGIFPVAGVEEGLMSYVLPALVIAVSSTAVTARLMRTTLLDTFREDYLRTARAKGLSERRVFTVHALRNALIPVVTVLAIDLGALLGGTIVTESVFNIPGIGFRITRAIVQRDTTMITGISIFLVMAYLVINLIVDMVYAWLDPRIRYD
ncbi:MAG: ABC transporter permease [Acidimicrobiia bacterium]|nr:ABC transporter permease [Acidimicrobiia bacterium]